MILPEIVYKEVNGMIESTENENPMDMALKQYAVNSMICLLESIASYEDEESISELWENYNNTFGAKFIHTELSTTLRAAIERAYKDNKNEAENVLIKLGVNKH